MLVIRYNESESTKSILKMLDDSHIVITLNVYNIGQIGFEGIEDGTIKRNREMLKVAWKSAEKVIMLIPDHNHSIPALFKNLIDSFTFDEMKNKRIGLIGYGATGGVRATEHMRTILSTFETFVASRTVDILNGEITEKNKENLKQLLKQLEGEIK